MTITTHMSGNCNFQYVSGLRYWNCDSEGAMKELLTQPIGYQAFPASGPTLPKYRQPNCGMYLFAHGSEDDLVRTPYAEKFKQFILQEGLGTVAEGVKARNPQHSDNVGVLYVWVIDQEACHTWWENNVLVPAKENIKAEKKAGKSAVQ